MAGEWRHLTLGDLCDAGAADLQTGPFGTQLHAHDYVPHGVPVVPTEAIRNRQIDHTVLPEISSAKADELARHRLEPGDILFARRGVQATGHIGYVREAEEGFICGTGAIRLRVRKNSDTVRADFLSHVLANPASVEWFKFHAIGATMPNLNEDIIRSFPLQIPPLLDQHAIAHVLGTLDDKIELSRQMNKTLEAMLQALFTSWFVDFDYVRAKSEGRSANLPKPVADLFPDSFEDSELGEMPKGWNVRRVSDAVDFIRGVEPGRSGCNEEGRGRRFIRVGEVTGKRISDLFTEEGSEPGCHAGDVLLSLDGTPGAVAYSLDGVFSSGIRKLVPRGEHLSQAYTWALAKSDRFQHTIREHSRGTTIQHAGSAVEYFRDFDPGSEIMAAFSTATESMWERLLQIHRESDCLSTVRDTLLPKLTTGELRVANAEHLIGRNA